MFYTFYTSPSSDLHCEVCGTTLYDISQTGMVGCAHCYDTFAATLLPYIRKMHGNTIHKGGIPRTAGVQLRLIRELEHARSEMAVAVATQEFEKAAKLRDQIIEIEKNMKGGENK